MHPANPSTPVVSAATDSEALAAAPHAMSVEEVLTAHGTDAHSGLSPQRVHEQRTRHGRNELARAARTPWWRRFAAQLANLIVLILIAAAVVSGVLGQWLDAVVILAIVLLNAVLGFIQEE